MRICLCKKDCMNSDQNLVLLILIMLVNLAGSCSGSMLAKLGVSARLGQRRVLYWLERTYTGMCNRAKYFLVQLIYLKGLPKWYLMVILRWLAFKRMNSRVNLSAIFV